MTSGAQVKDFTPVTLGFTFAGDKNSKNSSVDGGGIRFDVFSYHEVRFRCKELMEDRKGFHEFAPEYFFISI